MTVESIIIWLIVGGVAGFAAGQIVGGGGFGIVGDVVVGVLGALIAGWLLPRLGIWLGDGILGAVINAFVGACLLLAVVRLVRRA